VASLLVLPGGLRAVRCRCGDDCRAVDRGETGSGFVVSMAPFVRVVFLIVVFALTIKLLVDQF